MATTWVQRNYRVSVPVWGDGHDVIFDSELDARRHAIAWAREDKVLVLIWSYAAAMYVGRFDGREIA